MPVKDKNEKINITISDLLIKKETEKEIKTRVPKTYGDNVRYLILNKDDVEKIHDGATLLTALEKDKIYNLIGKSGEIVEQISGEKLFEQHYDAVSKEMVSRDKRKSVSKERSNISEDKAEIQNNTETKPKETSFPEQEKSQEKKIELKHRTLDSKHTKLEVKKAKLEDKNSKLQAKIKKAESKIEKWQAKKEDSQEALKHCQKLLDIPALPTPIIQFLKMYAESKENKIGSLNNKMGSKRKKVEISNDKITKNNQKIVRIEKKLNKLERIDTFLNNMHSPQGRRENFVNGLQEFRNSSLARSRSKLITLDKKIEKTQKAFETTLSSEDKVKLRNALHTYSEQRTALEEKIAKLEGMNKKLEAVNLLPDKSADELIDESCENVSSAISNNPDITPNQAVDKVLDISEQTIDKKFDDIKEELQQTQTNEQSPNIQDIEKRLNAAISYDNMFYGVLTDQTIEAIKRAGYKYENNELMPIKEKSEEKFVETRETTQQHSEEKTEQKTKRVSPLSRNAIKESAATIKAKETQNEAPKKVKSKGQEL